LCDVAGLTEHYSSEALLILDWIGDKIYNNLYCVVIYIFIVLIKWLSGYVVIVKFGWNGVQKSVLVFWQNIGLLLSYRWTDLTTWLMYSDGCQLLNRCKIQKVCFYTLCDVVLEMVQGEEW